MLILFIVINKESMHLLASFWVNFKLSDQLWHKIAFFYSIWLLFCGNCFSSVLAIPYGWLLNTGLTVCFFFINHCYSTLILFSLLFRKEMKSNKLSSNWSSSFWSWLITRKLISRKFSHNCGYYVTAKEAVVTSATVSYKIKEMHDSFEFKCKWATVSQENNKGGKKSAACSRCSKGNSGK